MLRWESDATGTRTEYSYDSLKRLTQIRRTGVTNALVAIPTIATNIAYDASGRTTLRTVVGANLALTNRWSYDPAGRLLTEISDTGLTTSYSYASGGRIVTTTLPTGGTTVRELYRDRRLNSQTGTAVVSEFHTNRVIYGDMVEIPLLDTIHWATPSSPRWSATGYDDLSLQALTRKPDFDGVSVVEEIRHHEDFLDKLASIETTGKPPTSYDLDFDGQLGQISQGSRHLADDGRVSATTRQYLNVGGCWFLTQTNLTFLGDGTSEATVTGVRIERLSGFASPAVLSEITTFDADNNPTVVTTCVDRSAKKITEVTAAPTSTLSATKITVNGLLISESTTTVATPITHFYDALGRETSVKSPFGFSAHTSYNEFGQVIGTSDFTGDSITYEYYPNGVPGAGNVKCEVRRNGRKTYHSYTLRGEPYRTWGDVPYPEERVYSQYGELIELHTFRGGSGWSSSDWPAATTGTPDVTTWIYQEPSGLLTNKTGFFRNYLVNFHWVCLRDGREEAFRVDF